MPDAETALALALAHRLGHCLLAVGPEPKPAPNTARLASEVLSSLRERGFDVVPIGPQEAT